MADTRDIDLEALLKRVEFLEKENHSLRAEVEELKTNDIEIKAELNTINRFISAMTESQSIDEIMTESESAAKQLTDSDVVLKGTSNVMKDFTKDGANGCFRMGGEKMVAILITDLHEEAVDKAEALRRRIENNVNEIIVDGKPMDYAVTVSIGVHEMQPDVPFTPANDGVSFSDRVTAMKEWADKALEKVNEKNIQKENVLKKNGGAR